MGLPAKEYSIEGFHQALIASPLEAKDMREVLFLTNFKEWGSGEPYTLTAFLRKRGFRIEQLGEMRKIAIESEPSSVECYAHLNPENRVLTFFTHAPQVERQRTINRITGILGIYFLWINPAAFDEIKDLVLTHYPSAKIRYFLAERSSSSKLTANIRPEFKRSIQYWGEDGRETLEELRRYYGVFPRHVEFRVPGVIEFRMSNLGVFHLLDGSIETMFGYSKLATEMVLSIRKILEGSRLEIENIPTRSKQIRVSHVIPWEIHFKRLLNVETANRLFLDLEENKFAVYNQVMTAGSVRLDATIYDEQKDSVFAVSSDDYKMTISPRYNTSFDSFLRFYQTVAESYDPEASCRTAGESVRAHE